MWSAWLSFVASYPYSAIAAKTIHHSHVNPPATQGKFEPESLYIYLLIYLSLVTRGINKFQRPIGLNGRGRWNEIFSYILLNSAGNKLICYLKHEALSI